MTPELNKIYVGDCREVMAGWPADCIDTIVTDPPYGLGFMGKGWDHAVPGVPFWAEMFRVCKPGAILLAFGGTRTWHRMAVAIEDAGWEIRDSLMWLYGSGFPKSLDISKAIDKAAGVERKIIGTRKRPGGPAGMTAKKGWHPGPMDEDDATVQMTAPATDLSRQYNGWGTALKPAWEPIIMAMKPIDGTFAHNAERWGVAGLNVAGGRIGTEERINQPMGAPENSYGGYGATATATKGRWPANLLLDEEAAGMFPDGESRFFYVAKADRRERNEGCAELPERRLDWSSGTKNPGSFQAEGTKREAQNFHPTVKPLDLMKYLCNLTRTPTGGIVLDPFSGSGTTLWAAECHNRPWIGIEMNQDYAAIAEKRIANERAQVKMAI